MPLYIIAFEIIFKSCRRDYTPHNKDPQIFSGDHFQKSLYYNSLKGGTFAFNLQSNNMNLIRSKNGFSQVKIKFKKVCLFEIQLLIDE